jgi:hypothetical protein
MAGAIPSRPTFSVGERVSASKMNALAAHADWVMDAPMLHLYLSGNVDLGTSTYLSWGVSLSSLSNFTITLPTEAVIVPYSGIWEWRLQVSLSSLPSSSNPATVLLHQGDATSTGSRLTQTQAVRISGATNMLECTAWASMTAGTSAIRAQVTSSTSGVTAYQGSRSTTLSGRLLQRL